MFMLGESLVEILDLANTAEMENIVKPFLCGIMVSNKFANAISLRNRDEKATFRYIKPYSVS